MEISVDSPEADTSTTCIRSAGIDDVSTPPCDAMTSACCASVRPGTSRTIRLAVGPTMEVEPVAPVGAEVEGLAEPAGVGVLLPVGPLGVGLAVGPVDPAGEGLVEPVEPVGIICANAAGASPNDDKTMLRERVSAIR